MQVCGSYCITFERNFECPMDANYHNKCSSGIFYCMDQQCGRKICLKPSKAQVRTT